MSIPRSPEEICNLAFDLLRHDEFVTSLDTPENDSEALASRWYDVTRLAALRGFPWNFAKKRTLVNRIGTPAFGYADEYQLPTDYCGVVFIGEDPIDDYEDDYQVEGNSILIDNQGGSTLKLCYIHDIDIVVRFDPIFTNLLAGELALVFGNAVAGLNKGLKAATAFRDRWEAKARSKNAQENPLRIRSRSPLISRRNTLLTQNTFDGTHLF